MTETIKANKTPIAVKIPNSLITVKLEVKNARNPIAVVKPAKKMGSPTSLIVSLMLSILLLPFRISSIYLFTK